MPLHIAKNRTCHDYCATKMSMSRTPWPNSSCSLPCKAAAAATSCRCRKPLPSVPSVTVLLHAVVENSCHRPIAFAAGFLLQQPYEQHPCRVVMQVGRGGPGVPGGREKPCAASSQERQGCALLQP